MKFISAGMLLAALLAAGCTTTPARRGPGSGPNSGPGSKAAALSGPAAAKAIFETDQAFARLAISGGAAAAFYEYSTPGSTVLPPAGPPIVGRDAIKESMFDLANAQLLWTPQAADAANSGELGWSWGTYEVHYPASGTTPGSIHSGKYVTVWRRQMDGTWKFAVDLGNQAPPAAGSRQ